MSDNQRGGRQNRPASSRGRNVSGDRSRRRTVSSKSQTRDRPKLELMPLPLMRSAYTGGSIPNLTKVSSKSENSRKFESRKSESNQLCLKDCFHFLQGNCKKGDDCNYRHQESARKATIVCKFWLKNECTNLNCSYLHCKSLPSKRERIPCHFEKQEGGCSKPDCNFFHEFSRSGSSADTKNVSEESGSKMATKCGLCGNDLNGVAFKSGKLIYCIQCGEMMK